MLTLPVAITVLSVSAPITAAIIKMKSNGGGKYATIREFDHFRKDVNDRMEKLATKEDVENLKCWIRKTN